MGCYGGMEKPEHLMCKFLSIAHCLPLALILLFKFNSPLKLIDLNRSARIALLLSSSRIVGIAATEPDVERYPVEDVLEHVELGAVDSGMTGVASLSCCFCTLSAWRSSLPTQLDCRF